MHTNYNTKHFLLYIFITFFLTDNSKKKKQKKQLTK